MKLFSAKVRAPILAIVDIDSTSVGFFVVDSSKTQPSVLFSHRQELPIQTVFSSEKSLLEIEKAVRELASHMVKAVGKIPDRIVVVCASPYSAAQTRLVKESYEKQTVITEKLLVGLVKMNIDEFTKNELAAYGSVRGVPTHTIIETNIIGFRLNGYRTHTPIGKTCSDLEIALYASIVPTEFIRHHTRIFKSLFHGRPVEFHSRIFALFNSFRSLFDGASYIVVDVSGEMTDINIVDQGILVDTMSFPVGRNVIVRTMAEKFAIPMEAALSRLNLGRADMQHLGAQEKVDAVVREAGSRWIAGLCEAFAASSEQYLLPEHVFLVADAESQDTFKEFLSGDTFCQYVFTDTPFSVEPIDRKCFNDGLLYPDGMLHDPVLAAEFLSLHTLYTQSFVHLM